MSACLARRVISRRRSNSVAFGAKRTFSEPRLPKFTVRAQVPFTFDCPFRKTGTTPAIPTTFAACARRCRCWSRSPSRRSGAGGSIRCSSMSAIAAISLRALPCRCEPVSHRGDGRRDRRPGADLPRAPAHPDARHHRRRARAQSAVPSACHRRARDGREGDGSLQSHHPGAAGAGRPRRIPRARTGRGRRLDAVLPGRQCRPPARQGRVRIIDPRPAEAQCARLRPRRARD